MVHRNARLAQAGRLILVQRVLSGRPVSHVAKELGVSRQCAHRGCPVSARKGWRVCVTGSSRPRSMPRHDRCRRRRHGCSSCAQVERLGRDELARRIGVSPSTASRIIARAGPARTARTRPGHRHPDPSLPTHPAPLRARAPGDLIHIDVKKLGRIPDGGGWRLDGPDDDRPQPNQRSDRSFGIDFIHVAVDDHSRLAFARTLPGRERPDLRRVPGSRPPTSSPATAITAPRSDDRQRA